MNQEWNAFLARQGLHEQATHFGHPAAELLAAQSETILAPLQDLGLIRASGPEAADFLHRLVTSDIENLAANAVVRSGLCTPKGRLLASLLIWRDGEDLLIAVAADIHAAILKKLSMYVLRSKLKLSDASQEKTLLGLSGPQAEAALKAAGVNTPSSLDKMHSTTCTAGQALRIGEQRYLLAVSATEAPNLWPALTAHARPAGLDAWHWLEIMAGMPQITAATQEAFVPQMVNFELIGGINFKKGCYPGQEIVARTQYLGKVKRRMYRARIETGSPVAAAELFSPETADQACGQIVNVAPAPQGGYEVLAVIQSGCADNGKIHLQTVDGPLLILQPLPYAVS